MGINKVGDVNQARTQGGGEGTCTPSHLGKNFHSEMSKRGEKVPPRYVSKKECAHSAQIRQNENEKGREK